MSLHHIGDTPNPYEQAISIIGQTLSAFDEDNLIPCYGFGDGSFSSIQRDCSSPSPFWYEKFNLVFIFWKYLIVISWI